MPIGSLNLNHQQLLLCKKLQKELKQVLIIIVFVNTKNSQKT